MQQSIRDHLGRLNVLILEQFGPANMRVCKVQHQLDASFKWADDWRVAINASNSATVLLYRRGYGLSYKSVEFGCPRLTT